MTRTAEPASTGAGQPERSSRRRVVVGVDGSPASRAVLLWALQAAASRQAPLLVATAVPLDVFWVETAPRDGSARSTLLGAAEARARALLDEVLADPAAPAGVDVQVAAFTGTAAGVLVGAASDAQLLVVGSRGRGAVRSTLLGSVALHCVSSAACPVAVLHGDPLPSEGRVVVGVDGSPRGRAALAAAFDEARRLQTSVEVVAAYEIPAFWGDVSYVPTLEQLRAEARSAAEEMVAEAVAASDPSVGVPPVEVVAAEGRAEVVLLERALHARLLVLGSSGTGAFRGMVLGSVAMHCVVGAHVPVLVVRPEVPAPATAPEPRRAETASIYAPVIPG